MMTALSLGLSFSMRAIAASTSSRGDAFFFLTSSAWLVASRSEYASLMEEPPFAVTPFLGRHMSVAGARQSSDRAAKLWPGDGVERPLPGNALQGVYPSGLEVDSR